jgi:myo-inositol 2-dehydrogenase/D-chiro-inositol 1-dehydrogenase
METDRRNFVKAAAAGALAPLFVSRRAWGANDRIAYGLIGTGNRGGGPNKSFQKVGAQCAALCDVYEPHLSTARKDSPAGIRTYTNYEELLAQPGLDCNRHRHTGPPAPPHAFSKRSMQARTSTSKSRFR